MPEARTFTGRLSGLVLSAVALLLSAAAPAAGGDLQAQVTAARASAAALAAGAWDGNGEEQLLRDLDAAVTELRARGGSASTAAALRRLVEDTRARHDDWLHRHQQAVIDADGDLEALQQSEEWKEREQIALQLLYLRNWLYLESATRFEPQSRRRDEWLKQAASGFQQLTGVDDPAIAAESWFGRALCERALDRPAEAIADLRRAQALHPKPELARRIGVALVEAQIDAGQIGDALASSAALLRQAPKPESEFLRAKAALLALVSLKLDAKRQRALRREVAGLVARLERRGGDWPRLARQLVAAGITRPEEWVADASTPAVRWAVAEALRAKGECREALPLYQAAADAQQTPAADVLLALAECRYRVGEYGAALDSLKRMPAKAAAAQRSDAAYLRFKVAEALDRQQPSQQTAAGLRAAAEQLLADFPDHPQAFEAYFRLGELARRRGDLLAAARQFDAVKGDERLELQAVFQSAQCWAEEWEAQSRSGAEPDEAAAQAALERLQKFLDAAQAYRAARGQRAGDEAVLSPLEARARVLGALLLVRGEESEGAARALEWLDGFDDRFPDQKDLQAQASAVRAAALLDLGRYAEARAAVERFVAAPAHDQRDYALMKRLGVRALQLADGPSAANDATATAALRGSALDLYEALLRAVQDGAVKSESPEGLRALVERLRRETS
jgi:hypothetical protein